MGSRTISWAAKVCQLRHVFRIIQVIVFTWSQSYSNQQTTIISNKLSENFPQLFTLASPFSKRCVGLNILQLSSSKLPKFPLLWLSDSRSIGPSHIPSFVLNVVSTNLPVDTTSVKRPGIQGSAISSMTSWPSTNGNFCKKKPRRLYERLMSILQISAMSNFLVLHIIVYWVVPLPSNSHHQDFTFLVGDPYKGHNPTYLLSQSCHAETFKQCFLSSLWVFQKANIFSSQQQQQQQQQHGSPNLARSRPSQSG